MKITTSKVGATWKHNILLVLVALSAAAILIMTTECRPGLNADSVTYLSMADQFLSGNGFSRMSGPTGSKPITMQPPFYPFLLAVTDLLGFEPLNGTLVLNAAALFINVILFGILLRQISDNVYLPIIAAFVFSVSPITLEWHSWAFSEPIYIALSLLSFYLLSKYQDEGKRVYILLISVLIGIALITRYLALSLLITMAVFLFLTDKKAKEKTISLFTLTIVSLAPLVIWFIRNIELTGSVSNHSLGFHLISRSRIKLFLNILWQWFVGSEFTFGSMIIVLAGLFTLLTAVGYLLLVRQRRYKLSELLIPPTLIKSMVMYIIFFCFAMVASISFVDFSLPIDLRHLFPIYPFVLIIFFISLTDGLGSIIRSNNAKLVASLLIIGLFTSYLVRDINLFSKIKFEDRGYGQTMAQHEYGYEDIANLPTNTLIYTNNLELLYLLYGRGGFSIPESRDLIRNTPNTEYTEIIQRVREHVLDGSAVLLYFNPGVDEIDPLLVEDMIVDLDFGNEILYTTP